MAFPLLAIPAIIGAVTATLNRIKEVRENKRTNRANLELAKYQAEQNQLYLDKQNAYNTPASQMARYGDAGLNPNLIYGQGNTGNQASPGVYEAPRIDMRTNPVEDISGTLSMYQDMQMRQAQIEKTEAETSYIQERNMLAKLQGRTGEFDLERRSALAPYDLNIRRGQKTKLYLENMMLSPKAAASEQQVNLQTKRMEMQNENLRMQNVFQAYEEQFRKMGVTNSDHFLVRVLTRMLGRAGLDYMK